LRRALGLAALLTLLLASATLAQVSIGDVVNLKQRDVDIPAHAAPGDGDVAFRFASGSRATILDIDSSTSWVRIRGTNAAGGPATGWITRKYIDRILDPGGLDVVSSTLDWCPPMGSPVAHPSRRLRLATWNLGNLHRSNGRSIYDDSVKRDAADYERIKCYIRLFDPDILAVQEVDGEAALRRVVDTEVYNLHVSGRGSEPGMQNTRFAYRKGLTVTKQPDYSDLGVNGKLRHGTRLDVTHNGQVIRMMSLHLKSGCFSNQNSGEACALLASQIPILESWIDRAAQRPEPFILLGDFNRRFNEDADRVWADLDDSDPLGLDLTAVTDEMPISCRDNDYRRFIDHLVLDQRALRWFERSSFRHLTFRQADRAVWDRISDHCPVIADLWIR
jgi:endonuclease/exonuclease/phosphatase family metal-dependent hydrolase